MIRVVCAGYVDIEGNLVPCGKSLGEKPDSHGQCEECYARQLVVLAQQEVQHSRPRVGTER